MTSTNHILTGAAIATVLPLPAALPLAFLSHFFLDALPHYGIPLQKRNRNKLYKFIVVLDIVLALVLLGLAAYLRRWEIALVGLIAYSPDLIWVSAYFKQRGSLNLRATNWFMKIHRGIQQFERPWGLYIELIVFVPLLLVWSVALYS